MRISDWSSDVCSSDLCLGLSFRSADQHHRPACQPSAAKGRPRLWRDADPYGARNRLHDAGGRMNGEAGLWRSLTLRLGILYVALFLTSTAALFGSASWFAVYRPLKRAEAMEIGKGVGRGRVCQYG